MALLLMTTNFKEQNFLQFQCAFSSIYLPITDIEFISMSCLLYLDHVFQAPHCM